MPSVIVAGAGLSGLTAARELEDAGVEVKILEASLQAGVKSDRRTEIVGVDHLHLRRLADSLCLTLAPVKPSPGSSFWARYEEISRHLPPLSASEVFAVGRIWRKIRALLQDISAEQPWSSPDALVHDRLSLGEWLKIQGASERIRRFADSGIGGCFTSSIQEMSLLSLLWCCRRGGGPFRALRNGTGFTFEAGSNALAEALLARIRAPIHFESRVVHVKQRKDEIEVSTARGSTFRAKRVILALPLRQLKSIGFTPELSRELKGLVKEMGGVGHLVFKPGQLTQFGPHLRSAHGLAFFAGMDRSSWPDQMEGAVESGLTAARSVIESFAQRNAARRNMKRREAQGSDLLAVVVDLDGVLTATRHLHVQAWSRAFDEYLQSLRTGGSGESPRFRSFDPSEDYENYVDGKTREDGIRSFLGSRGIVLEEGAPGDPSSRNTVHGLGSKKNGYYRMLLAKEGPHVFPDALEALRLWKAEEKAIAVVSSSENCALVLQTAGIEDFFEARVDGLVGKALHLRGKPAPDYFLEAAKRLGIRPEQSILVEDAIAGVEAGRRGQFGLVVGMDRTGGNAKALREHGADLVVSSLMELVQTDKAS